MAHSTPRLATVGKLALLLRVPVHRIQYVLRTRPHIRPRARAGGIRCFDDDAIAEIRHELNAIDARRTESDKMGGPHDE